VTLDPKADTKSSDANQSKQLTQADQKPAADAAPAKDSKAADRLQAPISSASLWRTTLKEAQRYYADGKIAYDDKKYSDARRFFQLAKDGYKEISSEPELIGSAKEKANKRIAKLTKDKEGMDGKYSANVIKTLKV
jgi:hypothetical protein